MRGIVLPTQGLELGEQCRRTDSLGVKVAQVVKLYPSFWKEKPVLWFAQVEAVFAIARITGDEARFRYTITNLDQTTLPFVSDIITAPPI